MVSYNASGVTDLYRHARRGAIVHVKELLHGDVSEELINCKQRNKTECTALHAAFYNGHYEIGELLLEAGADCNIINALHESPLDNAIWPKNGALPPSVVSLIMRKVSLDTVRRVRKRMSNNNIHLNTHLPCGWTLLHCACESGNLEIVKYIVKKGASATAVTAPFLGVIRNLEHRDPTDWNLSSNALHIAALSGRYDVVMYLTEIMNPNHVWHPKNKQRMSALRCLSYSPIALRTGNRKMYFKAFKKFLKITMGIPVDELVQEIDRVITMLEQPHPESTGLKPIVTYTNPVGLIGVPLSPLPEDYTFEGSLLEWLHVSTSPYTSSEINFPALRKSIITSLTRIKNDLYKIYKSSDTDISVIESEFDWVGTLLSFDKTTDMIECLLAGILFTTTEYRDQSMFDTTLAVSLETGNQEDLEKPLLIRIQPVIWRLRQLIDALPPTDPHELMYRTDAAWNVELSLGQVIRFVQFCVVTDVSRISNQKPTAGSAFLFIASSGPRIDFLFEDNISRKIHNIETTFSVRHSVEHALMLLLYWPSEHFVLREEHQFGKPNQKIAKQKELMKMIRNSCMYMSRFVLFRENWGNIDLRLKDINTPDEGLLLTEVHKTWMSDEGTKVLCIRGDRGSGKSTMATRTIQMAFDDSIKRRKPLIPLYIPVARLEMTSITNYVMQRLGISNSYSEELLYASYEVVLILDGMENYKTPEGTIATILSDECVMRVSKVFVTISNTFLDQANYSVTQLLGNDCRICNIQPLTEKQRQDNFGKPSICTETWLPEDENEKRRRGLKDIGVWKQLTTPLLLGLAGECKDGVRDHVMKTTVHINLQTIYGLLYSSVEYCASTTIDPQTQKLTDITRVLNEGSKAACHMLSIGNWNLPASVRGFSEAATIEGIPSLISDPFSFGITDIYNFFIAHAIIKSPDKTLLNLLGGKRFTKTNPEIVQLVESSMSSMLYKQRDFMNELVYLVKASRCGENPVSSNAFSLLVQCRVPIDLIDFSDIKISEADVSGGSFNGNSFINATFHNCNFTRTRFRRCNFKNCTFSGTSFGVSTLLVGGQESYTCIAGGKDFVLLGTSTGTLKKVSTEKFEVRMNALDTNDPVSSACSSPDGKFVSFSMKKQGIINIMSTDNSVGIDTISLKKTISQIRFTPNGQSLIVATDSVFLLEYDTKTGKVIPIKGHTKPIRDMSISRIGWMLASCSDDNTIRVWDNSKKKEVKKYSLQNVHHLAISSCGEKLAIVERGVLKIINLKTESRATLTKNNEFVSVAIISPEDRWVATIDGALVRVFDLATGEPTHILDGHHVKISVLTFTNNSLLSVGSDSIMYIWDCHAGRVLPSPKGHRGKVTCFNLSEDKKIAVTGGDDCDCRLWNATTGGHLLTLKGHTAPIRIVRFSPDSKMVVSGGDDCTVRVWDLFSGKIISTMVGHTKDITCANFSRDSKRIVSGSSDKSARIWAVDSGRLIHNLEGHSDSVNVVFFAEKDRVVMCGTVNHTNRVWNAQSGKALQVSRTQLFDDPTSVAYDPYRIDLYYDTICMIDESKEIPEIKREVVFSTGSTRHLSFIKCSSGNVKPKKIASLFDTFMETI